MMIEQTSAQDNFFVPGKVSKYHDTERVKIARFNNISYPGDILEELSNADGVIESDKPLYQVRFIMDQRLEGSLQNELKLLYPKDEFKTGDIIGKIPFLLGGEELALYYAQVEHFGRKRYVPAETSPVSHIEAVWKGLEKRRKLVKRPLEDAFAIEAVSYSTNQFWKVEEDNLVIESNPFYSEDELTEKAVALHKASFDRPHDESQRQEDGVKNILDNNVTLVAYNKGTRDLAAMGILEIDDRFSFENIALIEPTYFTHPNYRQHGLSVHIRQGTQKLIEQSKKIEVYDRRPLIVFNESIRTLSFPICLQVGCELAGDVNSSITGDLGDSYTYIGDAKEDTGLMPMGITYNVDRRLS